MACSCNLLCASGDQRCGGRDAENDGAGAGPARAGGPRHAQHAGTGCAAALAMLHSSLAAGSCSLPWCASAQPAVEWQTNSLDQLRQLRTLAVHPSPAVQCGATAYALGSNATERDAELVDLLFRSVGFCIQGAAARVGEEGRVGVGQQGAQRGSLLFYLVQACHTSFS